VTSARLDSKTDAGVVNVVEPMMRVQGEIDFDLVLAQAEVELAVAVYAEALPPVAYLPCCGALRHAPALLACGVDRLFAVDLSLASLVAGLARNVSSDDHHRLSVYHADVHEARGVLPDGGVRFIFLGGNSLGDVTDIDEHLQFVEALGGALAPGGVLVFDYAGDRYAPERDDAVTQWPEIFRADGADVAVLDRRAQTTGRDSRTAMSVLQIACEVDDAHTGEHLAEPHAYRKLIVPDDVLVEQFAGAGLDLVNVGRVVDLSRYHRERVRDTRDLGMLGTPNCYYRATKL
jgi:SAM-dependent methyltransferase